MFYAAIVVIIFFGPVPSMWKVGVVFDEGSPYMDKTLCEIRLAQMEVHVDELPSKHTIIKSECGSIDMWKDYLGRDPWRGQDT